MVDIQGVAKNYFKLKKDQQFIRRSTYIKYYEKMSVRKNVILYESFFGKTMNDNPFAIFKYLLDLDKEKKFTHIWLIANPEGNEYVRYYSKYPNVKFVKPHGKEYFTYLASAEYIVSNVTLPPYFIKKEDQIYINTWHGTPLKTLGLDMVGAISQNFNVQRNFLHADYLLSPNEFTTDKLINGYRINGIYEGVVLENGYPRIDSFFKESKVIAKFLMDQQVDLSKKIVLYAPTWRGSSNSASNNTEDLVARITELSEGLDTSKEQLLIKVHPNVSRFIKSMEVEGIVFIPEWMDINELIHYVDVLITDYSSVFFDFLVTDKPILFYMYDKEEYEATRGLYFDLEELPGDICKSTLELIQSIKDSGGVQRRNEVAIKHFKEEFTPYDHGNVTKEYVNRIFFNQSSVKVEKQFRNNKRNVVVYGGGYLNNGITSSLVNLSRNFDYDKYNLIVVDRNGKQKWFDDNVRRIGDEAHVIFRGGGINLTYPEWITYNRIFNTKSISDEKLHKKFAVREWRRILGKTRMDIAIDFGGYSSFWSYLMCFSNAKKKLIWQHNNMGKEYEKIVKGVQVHKKSLDLTFQLYKYFDKIISVGKLTLEENRKYFNSRGYSDKITYAPNLMDMDYLYDHRENPQILHANISGEKKLVIQSNIVSGLDYLRAIPDLTREGKNFINIGRLSPEKDQAKLIEAFRQVIIQTGEKHHLYIVGTGKEKDMLHNLTKSLDMEDYVFFTGQTDKAMELLDMCDCFVFSSNHEGQPMTLLECLAMDKPIIATDISGNRSVLDDSLGMVVDNSIEGLVDGMMRFLDGELIPTGLNVDEYNEDALKTVNEILDY